MIGRLAMVFAIGCGAAWAQQPIGTVGLQDATVGGALEVSNGRAVLVGSTTVTARDHTAEIALNRGGSVKVCSTSSLHATGGKVVADAAMPLMLALDRGAIEVKTAATANDVVMTPDLRFTLLASGPLDLQLRVTRNGDTCVENAGAKAPTLRIAEQFGDATYELRAGQHVLFEHGSLKEVVDRESSSCGCPPESPEPSMTIADALMSPGGTGPDTAKTAAEKHPFPAAVSAGLAPAAGVPQNPAGAVHAQVSATLSAGGGPDSTTDVSKLSTGNAPVAGATAAGVGASGQAASAAVQPAPKAGFMHSFGRFFKRLFGGGKD